MERAMTKIMYAIPSDLTIRKVIITPECINGGDPIIERTPNDPRSKKSSKK
jgi:ATP-dependent protease Clp ATPase subunit